MDTLKTATGKIYSSDYLATIPSPPQAYMTIIGAPMTEVATVFSDPAETVQLWHGENYLAQYTRLVALVPENGAIKVVLAKE